MFLDTRLAGLVDPFQARIRASAFGPELDAAAAELLQLLAVHRKRRADANNRIRLKALGLAADYLDAMGRAPEAVALLEPTVTELLAEVSGWHRELTVAPDREATRRLLRQRVWCCLAYIIARLRGLGWPEAERALNKLRNFVEGHLAAAEFPCHGTMALLHYYQGLWRRNHGQLNQAAWDFDAALDQTRRRFEDKQLRYQTANPDRYRRELIYSRVTTARVLGFGHGGIALSRGRYVEARAWLIAAHQILAQLGQETWRKSLEVYSRGTAVLIEELRPEAGERLAEQAGRLKELAEWLGPRNSRHAFLAETFALVAEARRRQIGQPLALDLTGLKRKLDALVRRAGSDAGPLATVAATELVGCLLRSGDREGAAAGIERLSDAGEPEWRLLRAELAMANEQPGAARLQLTELLEQHHSGRALRARAWALLAKCEACEGHRLAAERALAAGQDLREHVQDAWTKALLDNVATYIVRPAPAPEPMPYQTPDEDPQWCDLDHNLETARLRVVALAHERHPDYNVDRLAALVGRGPSWLYAFLGRHRELPWVREILD